MLSLALAACGAGSVQLSVPSTDKPGPPSSLPPGSLPASTVLPGTGTLADPTVPALAAMVDQARTDLADRVGVAPGEIGLTAVESVMWPDSSLGCPRPGFSYLQVLTEGVKIRLTAAGVDYEYHARAGGDPFLCDNPLPGGESAVGGRV